MKISDFINGRNVTYDTVRRYIRRNEDLFRGHIGKPGNIVLDDYAAELLEKRYPLPKPVEVIEDSEMLRKYNAAVEQIASLQQVIINLQQQIAVAAPKLALADQNEQRLEELMAENVDLKEKMDKQIKDVKGIYDDNAFLRHKESMWLEAKAEYDRDVQYYKHIIEELKNDKDEVKKALDAEKSKTWWDKLRGR